MKKEAEGHKRAREVALRLALPAGSYRAEWVEPVSGNVIKDEAFAHAGQVRRLVAPAFGEDVALRVTRAGEK